MKAINMLGVDYTEEKIQVLINYMRYMREEVGEITENTNMIDYVIKSRLAKDKYLSEVSDEDLKILEHFSEAGNRFYRQNPTVGLCLRSMVTLSASMCIYNTPFALKMGICAALAGFVTSGVMNVVNKQAYNKIFNIVKEDMLNETERL